MSEDEEDTLLEKIKNDRERRKQRKKGRIVFIENDDDGYIDTNLRRNKGKPAIRP